MPLLRNLLFIGLVVGGAATLGANLLPHQATTPEDIQPVMPLPDRDIVTEVDAVFRSQWAEQGLTPAKRASDLAIMRRLSMALTGTVPSLQEIREFEARPVKTRLPEWVETLLNDRRYADYWAERWTRAYVGTEAGPFLVFRRRRFVSWLSDELLRNRPYDELVRELIASDGIWTEKPATNFVTVTYDPEAKMPDAQRLAARTARTFLGVRIDCAQCHDHPFQHWKRNDFQGLAAFYGQTRSGFTGIHDDKSITYEVENLKTGKEDPVTPQVPFLPELLPAKGDPRTRLARWVTAPTNPYMARATVNRVWALMFGRPLVEPVDDLESVEDPPAVLQLLADDFVAHKYDLKRLIRVITATEVFHLDSAMEPEATADHEIAWAVFPLSRLRPEQVVGALLQAASLQTIDGDSHIIVKITTGTNIRDFLRRYGDTGEDEFDDRSGTIPQRLLMMNGEIVRDKIKADLFSAANRIATQAPTDRLAVEVAYLATLTRRPTPEEAAHFERKLGDTRSKSRGQIITDLYWTLLNATEFSWNH